MKTEITLLPIKGIKTPDFKEPKGDEFQTVMAEIQSKVEEKRLSKITYFVKIKQATAELNKVKNAIIMAEDRFRGNRTQEEAQSIAEGTGSNRRLFRLRCGSIRSKAYQ